MPQYQHHPRQLCERAEGDRCEQWGVRLQELGIALQGQSRLAGEKAELERVAQQHLLWSGQALVAGSLAVMEEAVQQIRTAFLMPSKELKCAPPRGPRPDSCTHQG